MVPDVQPQLPAPDADPTVVQPPSADSSGNTSTQPYGSDPGDGIEVDFATCPLSWQTFITNSTMAGRCSLGHGFAADDFDYMAHAASDAYQVLQASESTDALPWQKSDCHLVIPGPWTKTQLLLLRFSWRRMLLGHAVRFDDAPGSL